MGSGSSKSTMQTVVVVKGAQAFKRGIGTSDVTSAEPQKNPSVKRAAVLLSCHKKNSPLANKVAESMSDICDVQLLTEREPASLENREEIIAWCSIFITVASVHYQRHPYCMEAVNYARTKNKRILTIVGQRNYRPYGGLGAISIADENPVDASDWSEADAFASLIEALRGQVLAKEYPVAAIRQVFGSDTIVTIASVPSTTGKGILVSYHSATTDVLGMLLKESFDSPFLPSLNESSSTDSIDYCAVFIAILSPQYEESVTCRRQYETARALRKSIIPLIGTSKYFPSGWMGLAIAGKLFYKFTDRESAYTNVKRPYLDTVPMTDFKAAVNGQLSSLPDSEQREKAEIDVLNKKIEECKLKLHHWPPKKRGAVVELPPPTISMAELLADKGDNHPFNHIFYTVTRQTIGVPPPLFDSRGVPMRPRLDAFISYQWDSQEFVRGVYQNMHSAFSLKIWMDVYGGMQGNTNEAMANGVECSAVFLCFLSAAYYTKSPNCILELRYAVWRKKPIIFLCTADNLEPPSWINSLMSKSLVFTLRSAADCGVVDEGLPRLNRICDAVRILSAKSYRPPYDEDVTETVTDLRILIEQALEDIAEQDAVSRWMVCTRCGAKFDDNTRIGCRKHSAYYMGGTIIAGRWVCCSERSQAGLGCQDADHTTEKRVFGSIPGYDGCLQWTPA